MPDNFPDIAPIGDIDPNSPGAALTPTNSESVTPLKVTHILPKLKKYFGVTKGSRISDVIPETSAEVQTSSGEDDASTGK